MEGLYDRSPLLILSTTSDSVSEGGRGEGGREGEGGGRGEGGRGGGREGGREGGGRVSLLVS